ncbi:MAG: MATE family efflux transporter [Lachnospiraceae bacterium]|nr:MATE family efflux transporter [Lachnospiraceae bacterium]
MKQDMVTGSASKSLIMFALPMVLGNIFQQLYGLIDTIVVGNFVGEGALAAVGTSTALAFVFIAVAMGLSIGCSVVISQLFGAGSLKRMKTAIFTSIFMMIALGVVLTIVAYNLAGIMLGWMQTPDNIFADAKSYLQIYTLGYIGLFVYNISNSVFNALGMSKLPLAFLAFSSVLNIILDLLFVIKYNMGVAGVAWATFISQNIAAALAFVVLLFTLKKIKCKDYKLFEWALIPKLLKVAGPTCAQQMIVSLGFVFMQSLINLFGSTVIAGYTAATKIDNIALIPMVQVGNALSTFVAQNVGAGKYERVGTGLKTAMLMDVAFGVVIAILVFIFGKFFIALFMDSSESAEAIGIGVEYMYVVSIFYFLMGVQNAYAGAIRGAGDVKHSMICVLLNFGLRLVAAYILALFFIGEKGIWWSLPIGWAIGTIYGFFYYRSGKWKDKAVVGKM